MEESWQSAVRCHSHIETFFSLLLAPAGKSSLIAWSVRVVTATELNCFMYRGIVQVITQQSYHYVTMPLTHPLNEQL